MQASGFTRLQIAGSVMKTAIPLVLLTMAIGEWVAPQGEQMARNYRAQQMYGGSLLSTKSGLWAKDGNDFIYIERVSGDKELSGVNIYHFNDQRRLETVRYAATASFENGLWQLSQVDTSDLETGDRYPDADRRMENQPDPGQAGRGGLDHSLSISGLHNYVKYLKQSGRNPTVTSSTCGAKSSPRCRWR